MKQDLAVTVVVVIVVFVVIDTVIVVVVVVLVGPNVLTTTGIEPADGRTTVEPLWHAVLVHTVRPH